MQSEVVPTAAGVRLVVVANFQEASLGPALLHPLYVNLLKH